MRRLVNSAKKGGLTQLNPKQSPNIGSHLRKLNAGGAVAQVMHRLEALRILKAKLAAIEGEHHVEFAVHEDGRELDTKAEAQALAAVFDFLKSCKIAPTNSLLRIFKRYLRPSKTHASTPAAAPSPPSSYRRQR